MNGALEGGSSLSSNNPKEVGMRHLKIPIGFGTLRIRNNQPERIPRRKTTEIWRI